MLFPFPRRSGIHVLDVFFVFEADEFDQLGIGSQNLVHLKREGFRVDLRIVHRDLDFHMSEVDAAESFRNLGGIWDRHLWTIYLQ